MRPEPPARAEPMLRAVPDQEPAERPQRAARGQNSERLAGLAADLSRTFMDPDLAAPRRAAEARRPPPAPPQPVPSVQPLSEAEEQNLTEMAQRLESALQRQRHDGEHAAPEPAPPATPPTLRAVELPRIEPAPRAEPKPPRPEIVPAPAPAPTQKPAAKAAPTPINKPTTAKPAFGTLEQEMASLLGRSSSGKT